MIKFSFDKVSWNTNRAFDYCIISGAINLITNQKLQIYLYFCLFYMLCIHWIYFAYYILNVLLVINYTRACYAPIIMPYHHFHFLIASLTTIMSWVQFANHQLSMYYIHYFIISNKYNTDPQIIWYMLYIHIAHNNEPLLSSFIYHLQDVDSSTRANNSLQNSSRNCLIPLMKSRCK